MRASLALVAALVVLCLSPTQAFSHVKTDQGNWLFAGSLYKSRADPPQREERSSPLNVIVQGPPGADASIDNVKSVLEANWRDRDIPGDYPRGARMKPRSLPLCTDDRYAFMRSGNDPDVGTSKGAAAFMSTSGTCTNQYHLRMYSSKQHCIYFSSPSCPEWVVMQAHHDHVPIATFCGIGIGCPDLKHKVDLPQDISRRIVGNALERRLCVFKRWAVHPESLNYDYPGVGGPYDGVILRVSTRARSAGCDGA